MQDFESTFTTFRGVYRFPENVPASKLYCDKPWDKELTGEAGKQTPDAQGRTGAAQRQTLLKQQTSSAKAFGAVTANCPCRPIERACTTEKAALHSFY
ncbi:hypothetical protein JTB14_018774 [Gonioctena quinquepunctata]|nr:hypothetical protein JTB14_018774 [Gonioctena quinquepunctata]